MHPILFTLPLPTVQLRLLPALLALVLVGALVLLYAHRRQDKGLSIFGLALAFVAAFGAYAFSAESLEIRPLSVPSWGGVLGLWLIVAWKICQGSARRVGFDSSLAQDGFIVSALSGLVVSRALFLLSTLHEAPSLDALALGQGGLSGIGAVVGALAGAVLFFRRRRGSLWQWLDFNASNLCLGIVMLRLACYLHGCDFGVRLSDDAPGWLQALGTFPRWADPDQMPVHGSLAWVQQVQSGALTSDEVLARPVHPVQLYEAAFGTLLALLSWYLARRRSFHGQQALSVLLAYALGCFVFEVGHGDVPRGALGPALGLPILLVFGLLLFALAYTYGPALSIRTPHHRYTSILLSLVPAVTAAVVTWHSDWVLKLTVSQWLALILAFGVSYVWSTRERVSRWTP